GPMRTDTCSSFCRRSLGRIPCQRRQTAIPKQFGSPGWSGGGVMHPITDEEQFFRDFPNLIRRGPQSNFRVTSPATETPNCVAYAAGDPDRIWWPGSMFPVAWPREAPAEE